MPRCRDQLRVCVLERLRATPTLLQTRPMPWQWLLLCGVRALPSDAGRGSDAVLGGWLLERVRLRRRRWRRRVMILGEIV
jgi:hypothetical protein